MWSSVNANKKAEPRSAVFFKEWIVKDYGSVDSASRLLLNEFCRDAFVGVHGQGFWIVAAAQTTSPFCEPSAWIGNSLQSHLGAIIRGAANEVEESLQFKRVGYATKPERPDERIRTRCYCRGKNQILKLGGSFLKVVLRSMVKR